jgi:hypothetical protein
MKKVISLILVLVIFLASSASAGIRERFRRWRVDCNIENVEEDLREPARQRESLARILPRDNQYNHELAEDVSSKIASMASTLEGACKRIQKLEEEYESDMDSIQKKKKSELLLGCKRMLHFMQENYTSHIQSIRITN